MDDDRILPDNEDFLDEFDVVSLDGNGEDHNYDLIPNVVVPPDDHMNFYAELANNAYDFMNNYQHEHFDRMSRIQTNIPDGLRNLPFTLSVWDVGARIRTNPQTFVRYTNSASHLSTLRDNFFGNVTSPGVTNQEGDIIIPVRYVYNEDWIWKIECPHTCAVLTQILTEPVPPGVRCYDGALIDVEGFPLTQHYIDGTDGMVTHGPHPAFTTVNQDNPTSSFPSAFILPRWTTGPDRIITESNPLYQFARVNVRMYEWELQELPDVHIFNNNFFEQYDIPPNVNGQFAVLHHNFYGECYIEDVYKVNPDAEFNILARFESEPNPIWDRMTDEERMNHIDNAFIACQNYDEQTTLWTSMVPSLLRQRKTKRTHRACRHCEMNRKIKISLISRILGGAD
eukprot:scaffold31588_cov56-Attheya_sp.AAC.1